MLDSEGSFLFDKNGDGLQDVFVVPYNEEDVQANIPPPPAIMRWEVLVANITSYAAGTVVLEYTFQGLPPSFILLLSPR